MTLHIFTHILDTHFIPICESVDKTLKGVFEIIKGECRFVAITTTND